MNETEHLERFSKANISEYPDVHGLSLPNQALWVLLVAKEQADRPYLSSWEIAQILAQVYDVSVTPQGVLYALRRAGKKVHKRKVHSKRKTKATLFSIMEEGKRTLSSLQSVMFISPEAAFTGLKNFEEVLGRLKGDICICDPWVDKKTLDVISMIPSKCEVKLLTINVKDYRAFKRYYEAFKRQYRNLEIKICQKSVLHDRYIISSDGMLLIGQSFSGIGKKQTFIVQVGKDIKEQMIRLFNQLWAQSRGI